MKKTFKMLFLALISIFASFTSIVNAATGAPSTITMGTGHTLTGYVNGTYFSTKVTKDGKFAYCTDISKKTPNGMKMTLVEAKDAGLTYIVENGYPNKKFTGNADKDYYITQSAVWWYLDDTTGSNNLSNSFKTNGSDPHGLRKYIKQLVADAKEAKSDGYVKPSITLTANSTTFTMSSDSKYYYSDYITVKGTAITGKISLTLSGAPSGSTIVNSNGSSVTEVSSGTKVRIKVEASKVSKLETSITIKAAGKGSVDKAYMYKPSDSSYQPVVIGVLFPEITDVSKTKAFTLKATQVAITKVDSETGKPLEGAKMQLKDSKGNVVASWTSTKETHVIKNLPAGTYKLIEKQAPNGYKLNETVQEVVLKAGVVTKVTFYNTKKEPTKVVIIKRDTDTNETLAGAVFVLKNSKGEEVTRWTSTEKGHYVQGLPEGEYTVEEISAPEGYVKSNEVKKVKLEAGKTVTVDFYNKKKEPTKVVVIKRDKETNETLEGAVFVLRNSKGEEVTTWTSTKNGHYVQGLPEGEYTIEEISAPAGYIKSDEIQTVKLESGKTVTVTFYNQKEEIPFKSVLQIRKVNGETGENLAGATMVLKDSEGNVVKTWVTTNEDMFIEDLQPGKYYLSETEAPQGFVLSTEVIEIEVSVNGGTVIVTFFNTPEVEVPDTDSNISTLAIMLGIITIAVGGSVVYINYKKEA